MLLSFGSSPENNHHRYTPKLYEQHCTYLFFHALSAWNSSSAKGVIFQRSINCSVSCWKTPLIQIGTFFSSWFPTWRVHTFCVSTFFKKNSSLYLAQLPKRLTQKLLRYCSLLLYTRPVMWYIPIDGAVHNFVFYDCRSSVQNCSVTTRC